MFECKYCGKKIYDGDNGEYSGCHHFSVITVMLNHHHGSFKDSVYHPSYHKPTLEQMFVNIGYRPIG